MGCGLILRGRPAKLATSTLSFDIHICMTIAGFTLYWKSESGWGMCLSFEVDWVLSAKKPSIVLVFRRADS